jgi:AcrR family transcriptional regulator
VSVKTAPGAPSLRDARKTKTRLALRDAALTLFAAQGYDATSTEQIAEKAGVSWRTFFRYFPTKESALFAGEGLWFESLADIYYSQPPELSDIDAMYAAFMQLAASLPHTGARLRLYERSAASSPTLRGLRQDHQDQHVQLLADTIAARRSLANTDESCLLLAAVGVMTWRRALERWLKGPEGEDVTEVVTDTFSLLRSFFNQSQANNLPKRKAEASPQAQPSFRPPGDPAQ